MIGAEAVVPGDVTVVEGAAEVEVEVEAEVEEVAKWVVEGVDVGYGWRPQI